MTFQTVLYAIAIGYLLGSIPFGLLLTRAVGIDIRSIGSGNIGATNVLRTGNKWLAAATLLLDATKGAAAVLIARYLLGSGNAAIIAGLAAFAGHIFPIWLRFKGGKGVATYIGVLLAWNWIVGLIFCAVWLVIALARRYSSLAAITAAATSPIFAYVVPGTGDLMLPAACGLMSVILMMTHWQNIHRLWKNTEPKIGEKKKVTQDN
ncbi:MAG TPA: glycerol-3-phosphate 1-O-acyltransferase PlsY [Devosia sp.]|nr:glycerol-3-phosphate 1-O-acyltransferase PlsY [Devosia sp.]